MNRNNMKKTYKFLYVCAMVFFCFVIGIGIYLIFKNKQTNQTNKKPLPVLSPTLSRAHSPAPVQSPLTAPSQSDERFGTTTKMLAKVKTEIKDILTNSVRFDIETLYGKMLGNMNEYEIIECVKNSMIKNGIPFDSFNMDGSSTMNEPIIKMYNNNRQVYDILAQCNFLNLIGRIIAIAALIGGKKEKSENTINRFTDCLNTIDFSDIKVWNNISETVNQCLK